MVVEGEGGSHSISPSGQQYCTRRKRHFLEWELPNSHLHNPNSRQRTTTSVEITARLKLHQDQIGKSLLFPFLAHCSPNFPHPALESGKASSLLLLLRPCNSPLSLPLSHDPTFLSLLHSLSLSLSPLSTCSPLPLSKSFSSALIPLPPHACTARKVRLCWKASLVN